MKLNCILHSGIQQGTAGSGETAATLSYNALKQPGTRSSEEEDKGGSGC